MPPPPSPGRPTPKPSPRGAVAQAHLYCKLASGLSSVGLLAGGRHGAGVPCVSPQAPSVFVLCLLLAAVHLFPEVGRLAGGESPCQLLCLSHLPFRFLVRAGNPHSAHRQIFPRSPPRLLWLPPGLQPPCLPISLLPGPQAFPPCFTPPLTISSLLRTLRCFTVTLPLLGLSQGLQFCSREGFPT